MPILLLDPCLFKDATSWKSNSSDTINKPQSLLFVATQTATGSLLVQNALDKKYGGALVSKTGKYPVNPYDPTQLLPYSAWHFRFRFVPETYDNLARFENDLKGCIKTRPNAQTPIPNVANWSTQWNRETNSFQIDHDPPAWVDSGYYPSAKVTTPDEWHSIDFRFFVDVNALTFSIESIRWDDDFYVMPEEHRHIPLQQTNWEQCAKYQLQNEGLAPGTVLIEYDDGIAAWSDQPIGDEIPSRESYEATT